MSETTYTRPWRFGAIWECELDSLADRLLCDADLRDMIIAHPDEPEVVEFVGRARKLAETQGRSYPDQLGLIIERAVEHAEAS